MILRCALLLLLTSTVSVAADAGAVAALEKSRADLAAGRYAQAVESSGQAAQQFRSVGDAANEGNAITVRGIARLYSGEYPAALADAEESLRIARQIGDFANQVTRLNNIGNVYYFQGRYSAALSRYLEAERLVQSHAQEKWYRARRQLTVANLATLYQRLGLYERALATYRELRAEGESRLAPAEQAQMLANMGTLYRRAGDPVAALETYRQAQALYQREHLLTGEVGVLNNIGILQVLDNGDLAGALATFDQALRKAASAKDRQTQLHATLYRAETLLRMGRLSQARGEFASAMDEAGRLSAKEEIWKALYGRARVEALEGHATESQRLLRESVRTIEALRGEIGSAASTRGYLTDKRLVFDELIAQLVEAGGADVAEIFRLMEQSRARSVKQGSAAVRSLSEVQGQLAPGEALVEFWIDRPGTHAAYLLVRRDRAAVRAVPEVRGLVQRLVAKLSRPGDASWKADAEALRKALVPAVAGVSRWIIMPDRELAGLPLEVLLGPAAEVGYLPAASLLRAAPTGSRAWRGPWARDFVGIADPAPHAGADLAGAAGLLRLPQALPETRDAAAALGDSGAEIHAGADAVRPALRPAPVLHLATHAKAAAEDPSRSWLLLAAPEASTERFDYLFVPEVEGMKLSGVDLVTLSACETERGKLQEGEGPRSFSRAFLSAGARTVVTSLWRIEDSTARAYMQRFYAALGDGADAVAAARDARVAVAAMPGREHPFYWAAFVVTGDARLQLPRYVSWTTGGAAAAMLGGIGLTLAGMARRRRLRRRRESRESEPGQST